jgi:hypothetical protein
MKKQIYLMVVAACLGLLTKAQTVIPSYVPTNGLVGWWPFNGNANDESGSGNNGNIIDATLANDRFNNVNKSYMIDGVNCPNAKGISLPALINNSNAYSISIWYKTSDSTKTAQTIFNSFPHQYIGVGFNYPFNSSFANKTSVFYGNSSWLITGLTINWNTYNLNNWKNVIVIKTTTEIKFYQNGILVFTEPLLSNYNSGNFNAIVVGASSINGGSQCYETFKGSIDDIGIWNRALTTCEVKKLYTSGSFSVSSSASNTICVGQSLNLTAAGATTYNWSTGATSQSISVSPTVSTVYTVSTTYSAGCTDSRTFNVTINACTGLNEAELLTNSVRVFPNPAKEQLNIMVNNNAVMGKKYSITNTLGQEVASGIFNKQTTELNIQQLSAGLYQINIEGLNENYKFIKE